MRKLFVTWIVVADSHKALLFKKTNEQKSTPTLIHTLEAQLEIFRKKPGRTFNSSTGERHSFEPHTDPKELEKQNFAHEIREMLDDVAKHSHFDELVLIAPPKLIGILDKDLDKQIHKKLTHKITTDIMDKTIPEICSFIDETLKKD